LDWLVVGIVTITGITVVGLAVAEDPLNVGCLLGATEYVQGFENNDVKLDDQTGSSLGLDVIGELINGPTLLVGAETTGARVGVVGKIRFSDVGSVARGPRRRKNTL
jgi:hypothetical protein